MSSLELLLLLGGFGCLTGSFPLSLRSDFGVLPLIDILELDRLRFWNLPVRDPVGDRGLAPNINTVNQLRVVKVL